jgi:hypothetical protein
MINYGLWGMTSPYQFPCQLPSYLRKLFKRFVCRPSDLGSTPIDYYNYTLPPRPDSNIGYNACSWRDYETPELPPAGVNLPRATCLERFPGRLVYRSAGAKFDWNHVCVNKWPYPRNMVSLHPVPFFPPCFDGPVRDSSRCFVCLGPQSLLAESLKT